MHFIDWLRGELAYDRDGPQVSGFDDLVELECIRRELAHALRECNGPRQAAALGLIRGACNPLDLWLLRPEIFTIVAQARGQSVATERIKALTPLFRGWVPRTMESSARSPTSRAQAAQ
jgi:hypothetical protein